jgi:Tol biopolymer transport system component
MSTRSFVLLLSAFSAVIALLLCGIVAMLLWLPDPMAETAAPATGGTPTRTPRPTETPAATETPTPSPTPVIRGEPTSTLKRTVSERTLAHIETSNWITSMFAISADSRHVAYGINLSGGKQRVSVDGKEHRTFDALGPESLSFSADGQHVAYVARLGNKWFVVLDGKEGKGYDGVTAPIFSPDGKRLAYGAIVNGKWAVVADNRESKGYDNLVPGTLTFSPDSKHFTYGALVGKQSVVVVDGKEGKAYESIANVVYSPDSQRYAYAAKSGGVWRMVVNGAESKRTYEQIGVGNFTFSPDSKQVAHTALIGGKWTLFVDEFELGTADSFMRDTVLFSPDNKHLAYVMRQGSQWITVLDNKQGPPYDSIEATSLRFSADSQRLAYTAKKGAQSVVVVAQPSLGGSSETASGATLAASREEKVNGETQGWTTTFSPDGALLAYVVTQPFQQVVVVDRRLGTAYDAIISKGGKIVFAGNDKLHYLAWRGGDVVLVEEQLTKQ